MALKALIPIGIMAGAVTTLGYFTGQVGKQRQYVEHSHDWETGLKKIAGVIPPRTHIAPFIAKPHPALEGREIPIYATGALQSQIIPGGPLDPYANPRPSEAAMAKERARLKALPGCAELIARAESTEEEQPGFLSKAWNFFRPADPDYVTEPLRLRDGSEVGTMESWEQYRQEKQLERFREVYRRAPLAEQYRIEEFAKLHPELTVDQARLKTLNFEKRQFQY